MPIIFGEAAWFGIGGMLNAWLPVSPGWIWLGVTVFGVAGLLVYYRSPLTKVYLRAIGRAEVVSVDAAPVAYSFHVPPATGTAFPPSVFAKIRRFLLRVIGIGPSRTVPVRDIAEIERCQQELVKYIRSQPPDPITFEHNALSLELLPHVERACQILDEQDIPYPGIDMGIVFESTGKWGTFLARLLAVKHDVEKARLVYGQMQHQASDGNAS